MPELPEVETVVRQLAPVVTGHRVRLLKLLDTARLKVERPARLRGRRVAGVQRVGKWVVLVHDDPDGGGAPLYLAVHLRMTGRLIWRPSTAAGAPATRQIERTHLRAWLGLEQGRLLFYDPRRFGVIRLLTSTDPIAPDGVDPLLDRFGPAGLARLLDGSRQPLKAWLLRQDRLVGLGNIYASEILFRARLHPERAAGSLDRTEIRQLHRATRGVLAEAVSHCGTTFSDFQGAHGTAGSYQHYLSVYGRQDQPCPGCGAPIERIVQHQRSTFFCPRCQRCPDPQQ